MRIRVLRSSCSRAVVTALSACATVFGDVPAPPPPAGAAPAAAVETGPADAPRGTSLEPPELSALIERALARHPRIDAARQQWEASQARIEPAGALDDPIATLAYQNDGLSEFTLGESEDSQIAVGIAQPLPGRGKRDLRRDAAARTADADALLVPIEELALRRAVVSAWWRLAYEQEVQASLGEQKILADLAESLARARYGAGEGEQVDVLRARLGQARLVESLEVSAATLPALREELRGELGLDATAEIPDPGPLPDLTGSAGDPDGEVARALGESPVLERLARSAVAADARTALARGDYRADYVLGGSYMYRGSAVSGRFDPMVAVSLGVRLPVHRAARLDPSVAAATADSSTIRSGAEAQRLLLATRTRQRLAIIRAASASARLLGDGIVPQDRAAVDAAITSYRSGRGEILPVLSALETLLADRLERSQRLLQVALERIALETFSLDPPGSVPAMGPRAATGMAMVEDAAAAMRVRSAAPPPVAPGGAMGGMR